MVRQKRSAQQVRIIGGKYKGRKLRFTGDETLRPTLGRVRETLFNWLRSDIQETYCLDAFAGSGILGFEALSQGASQVVMVDKHVDTIRGLKSAAEELDIGSAAQIIRADVLDYLAKTEAAFDVIFLDPPFARPKLLSQALELIAAKQPGCQYIYAEARTAQDITAAAQAHGFTVAKQTRAGDSVGILLTHIAAIRSQG